MTRTHSGKVIPVFLAAVVLAGLVQSVTAQQSTPKSNQDDVIRVDTSLIQVRAVVTDRAGKLVDNLKQDEFEILENGIRAIRSDRPRILSWNPDLLPHHRKRKKGEP